MKSLYFVAALTRLDIEHNIWNMKDEVAKATGSVRGLKVLPHITMMYPFKFSSAEEDNIIRQLSALISTLPRLSFISLVLIISRIPEATPYRSK